MGAQENLRVVKNGYAAFGRGDVPGLLALFAEDIEWHVPGKGLPAAGDYRGRSGVADFFQKLAAAVEFLDFQPREFVAEGDNVLVIGSDRAKVKSTNRILEVNWVHAFTLRDGKVTKFREFTDTQAIAAAFEGAARAAD
jgi:uncharacterized protein